MQALSDISFNFYGSVFSEKVEFRETTIDGNILFSNITFKKSVVFSCVQFTGNLQANFCTFYDLEFISSSIKELVLLGNNFRRKFKISQSDIKQSGDRLNKKESEITGEVEKIKIRKLAFLNNTVATGTLIRFGYLDVDNFDFQNMRNPINSEINIGECDFNKFILRNIRNNGKFRIYRINAKRTEEENETFILTDSSLGDSEFQNVNLKCYKNVYITDNLLSGLKYTEMQWPDKLETDPANSIQKKKETYRNLKNVALENNDAPQAIEFYAKEMEAYSSTLKDTPGKTIDKLILWFNYWTNKFGLNWVLPIFWVLLLGFISYSLLLWTCSCIADLDNWGKFFVFLNPTHKTEFVCKGYWGFSTYLIDLLFRAIEATLIYQTIVAFRKFTRKL